MMKIPPHLSFRQTLEGMSLSFNPSAANGLNVAMQFDISGNEPGLYHLRIAAGECTFHDGPIDDPSLTINTPSEVWLAISRGEMGGQEALMQGLYTAQGDLSLLCKWTPFSTVRQR